MARTIRGDSPLFEACPLRDSITWTTSSDGMEAVAVGTDSEIGFHQEMGSSKIPPRRTCKAPRAMEDKVHKMGSAARLSRC
ncbi:hypothetical protein [Bradyrhizobium sp. Ai1a-2]|uniref:hypothetical protein n=1 Tax=Bradyrhizobium sp. Ai1a-2 TaxID=196490 RepID=UPI000426BB15|nr:hypothetical protein [Bradyrhizobium sp. Ai1a-2]